MRILYLERKSLEPRATNISVFFLLVLGRLTLKKKQFFKRFKQINKSEKEKPLSDKNGFFKSP